MRLLRPISRLSPMKSLTPKLVPSIMKFSWLCKLLSNLSANCRGVKSPSELRGRNPLSSFRHFSIFSRASSLDKNPVTFRHSSRSLGMITQTGPFFSLVLKPKPRLRKDVQGQNAFLDFPDRSCYTFVESLRNHTFSQILHFRK